MRITTVQTELIWQNKTANLKRCSELLATIPPNSTDVVILPEMFTSGFTMNPQLVKEPLESDTMSWMLAQARRLNAVITGSIVCEVAPHQYTNTLIWMQPDNQYALYHKRHLFSFAGEHEHYQRGEKRLLTEWRNWRFCPLICYDLRFPVWSRNIQQKGARPAYDVLIYVANWPAARRSAWKSLLVARAIENQAYVVGVNIVGRDGNQIEYSGDTTVVDFSGMILYEKTKECDIQTHCLDDISLQQFRQRFRFLEDQD